VYVLESKGEHLVGSPDTEYKDMVLQKMTGTKPKHQMELNFGQVNEEVEFYLVEEGKEDSQIRTLF
jgi:hypothetical protein